MTAQISHLYTPQELNDLLREMECKVRTLVSLRITNKHDIFDVTQDILIRVYKNIHKYDPARCKLDTWVYRITQNICVDYYRRMKPVELMGDQEWYIYANECVEDVFEKQEFSTQLQEALRRLPSIQGRAFVLKHLQGLSLDEICYTLDLPLNTVKSHIHRAKGLLKRMLVDYAFAA